MTDSPPRNLDRLIRLAPLISRPVVEHRQAIKSCIVHEILTTLPNQQSFKATDVWEAVKLESGLAFSEATIAASLAKLVQAGSVSDLGNGRFQLKNGPKLPSFHELTEPAWKDYLPQLRQRYPDLDEHFADADARGIFDEVLLRVFSEIAASGQELSKQLELLPSASLERVIDAASHGKKFGNRAALRETLCKYLLNPTQILSELFVEIYQGLLNYDVLSREEEFGEIDLRSQIESILVDTNVLAALLCETDSLHLVALAACQRAVEMGISLRYLESTEHELNSLIQASLFEMRGLSI
ncbi:MAG: hypothetical protein KGJ69_14885, partial [Thermoplasmata archaeon]|nr:hypothetical protein [Thermoplasmata archaeon]